MAPKGNAYLDYEVHGDDVKSLRDGFAHIQMPLERWDAALGIVQEVLVANDVAKFCWYKPPATNQLCGYWDDAELNMIWISPSEVHISAQTPRPQRAPTTHRDGGAEIGWLLPGASSASGGGHQHHKKAAPMCPTCSIALVGSECSYCGFTPS